MSEETAKPAPPAPPAAHQPKAADPRFATAPTGTREFIGDMPVDENGMDLNAAAAIRSRREAEASKKKAREDLVKKATQP